MCAVGELDLAVVGLEQLPAAWCGLDPDGGAAAHAGAALDLDASGGGGAAVDLDGVGAHGHVVTAQVGAALDPDTVVAGREATVDRHLAPCERVPEVGPSLSRGRCTRALRDPDPELRVSDGAVADAELE